MEALGLDNIMSLQEIDNLFEDYDATATEEAVVDPPANEEEGEKNNSTGKTTEAVDQDDLFEDEDTKQPESVGSEKNNEGKGDTTSDKGSGASPNNFYSSMANALAVDGIFPNLDEEAIEKVNDAETFSELIEAEVNARLDEKQLRISKALENGVEPNVIRQYEGTLNYLNSLTDTMLGEESEKGEELRQRILYQDFVNRGYKPEKAQKLVQRTIDAGTDVEDAKEALQNNKEFFQEKYNELQEEAQMAANKAKEDRQKQGARLKKSILEDKELAGNIELSKDIRKKIYDTISRPVFKDPDTGKYLTALQKYEMEHHEDFIKYVGLFMTMTNGFKDFSSFAKAEARKEIRKGLKELEQTLSNTRRNSDGSLNFVGSRKSDPESFLEGNFKLAL